MYQLKVKDMTCGHCASRITKAIKAVDPLAVLDINLEQQRIHIKSTLALTELTDAMKEAGYPAENIAASV